MNYYNENDKRVAKWLRNLIAAGLIPRGDVDERSIQEVRADELYGYTQCHFFAGIGGWSRALELAGWPEDLQVWTGSCPCQPFSGAGKRKGTDDDRHLWPEFFRLIRERRPPIVFGEQVASKDGRAWLSGVRSDLETLGYAVGAADLCAAGIGAPHVRQRLFWVGDSGSSRAGRYGRTVPRAQAKSDREWLVDRLVGDGAIDAGATSGMADADCWERNGIAASEGCEHNRSAAGRIEGDGVIEHGGASRRLADGDSESRRLSERQGRSVSEAPWSGQTGSWSEFEWIPCGDGKARRIEPGLSALVDGVSKRMVRLLGYGNAIVPELAAEFVMASREAL